MDDLIEGKVPVFSLEYPFDAVKVIVNTLLGEPRLLYSINVGKPGFDTTVNANWKNPETGELKELFKVITNAVVFVPKKDIEYVDLVENEIHKTGGLDFPNYGNIFIALGKHTLNMLAVSLMHIDYIGKKDPVSNDLDILYHRLDGIISSTWQDFNTLTGVYYKDDDGNMTYVKGKHLLDLSNLPKITKRLYERIRSNNENWIEFGEALAVLFGALSSLLLGITIRLGSESIVDIGKMFNADQDIMTSTINDFCNSFMASQTIDITTKNRYISLLIVYNKIFRFYESYAHFFLDDPAFNILLQLGAEFEALPDEKKVDIIDLSVLTQSDIDLVSNITFESFLTFVNYVENPAGYIANMLNYDTSNKFLIASYYRLISNNTGLMFADIENEPDTTPPFVSYMFGNGEDERHALYEEGNALGFYTYFVNNIVGGLLKNSCNPKLYHLISLATACFSQLIQRGNASYREYMYAGLYQGEALMTYLWHDWFRSGKTYKVEPSVVSPANKAIDLLFKANRYVLFDISQYLLFERSATFNDAAKTAPYIADQILSTHLTIHENIEAVNSCDLNLANIMKMVDGVDINKLSEVGGSISGRIVTTTGLKNLSGKIYDEGWYDDPIEIKAEKLYDLYYSGKISLISLYGELGIEKASYGLMYIKEVLEREFEEETLSVLDKLDFDKSTMPFIVSNILTGKIGQNMKKVISGKFGTKDRFNTYFTLMIRILFMIGFSREVMYRTIEDPEYLEKSHNTSLQTQDELNYDTVLPYLNSHKQFTFLNRR